MIVDEHNYDLNNKININKINDNLVLISLRESCNLWPVSSKEKKFFYDFFDRNRNNKIKIIFIFAELNAKNRILKFNELLGIKNNFEVFVFPFYLVENFWFDYFFNELINDCQNIKKTKTCNCLVAEPRIYRLMFLSEFYKNQNFQYTFLPHYTLNNSNFNDVITPKLPYEWRNSELKFLHNKHSSCYFNIGSTSKLSYDLMYDNGFSPLKEIKTLTEFDFLPITSYNDLSLEEMQKIESEQTEKDRYGLTFFVPKETFETFFDVNLESYIENTIFITEKTFKCLAFKRPFITFGPAFFSRSLKKLGFELYEEFFDYNFDLVENVKSRFDLFVLEIKRLLNLRHDELQKKLDSVQEKLEYNRKFLKTKISEKNILQNLIDNDSIKTEKLEFLKKYDSIF